MRSLLLAASGLAVATARPAYAAPDPPGVLQTAATPTAPPAPASSDAPAPSAGEPPPSPAPPETEAERARLEAEIEARLGRPAEPVPPPPVAAPSSRFLELSFDLLAAAGGSTADDGEIAALQGGDHDPLRRGFTIQNFEITGTGAVDPYFTGEAHLVLKIDPEGETRIELEEAFLTTSSLPAGLQLKAGQMFEAFGRQNPRHPHAWQFVDQNLPNTRFLGPEGLRSQGAELSWLAPTPWFLLVTAGAFNANGETQYSFVNREEPPYYASAEADAVDALGDLQSLARVAQNFDLGDTISTTFGASWARGPNATGAAGRTDLLGADLYLRWRPLLNDRGWPFVQVQVEWMSRRYVQAEGVDEAGTAFPREVLWDWAYAAHLVWGLAPRWSTGVRFEQAGGDSADTAPDAALADRTRVSPALTFYPSEFSKLRLQYNFDHVTPAGLDAHDDHTVWLQVETLLGKHGAHKF